MTHLSVSSSRREKRYIDDGVYVSMAMGGATVVDHTNPLPMGEYFGLMTCEEYISLCSPMPQPRFFLSRKNSITKKDVSG